MDLFLSIPIFLSTWNKCKAETYSEPCETFSIAKYFRKKLYLWCLTGFCILLCEFHGQLPKRFGIRFDYWEIEKRDHRDHITSSFLKAVFHKFNLIHSWIRCPSCYLLYIIGIQDAILHCYDVINDQIVPNTKCSQQVQRKLRRRCTMETCKQM